MTARLVAFAVLLSLLLLGLLIPASADLDWNRYYQFRHSSALSGNLFGVTPEGEVSMAGALQQNIPVAYTPAWGNLVFGGNSGSNDSGFSLSWGGSDVNGTANAAAGFSSPGHGVFLSWMATGNDLAEAWNVQVQVLPGSDEAPALAVGVQDVLNERERFPGEHHNARTVYITASGRVLEADWRPLYWTVGYGNGRFNNSLFGGSQSPVDDHLKLVGEYDGFQPNVGLAYGLNGADSASPTDLVGYVGYSGLERPVVGLTLTWHD